MNSSKKEEVKKNRKKTHEEREDDILRKKKAKSRFLALFYKTKEIDDSLNVAQRKLAERFNVKEQTFKETYNGSKEKDATKCNPELVINFCHQYGIDPYDVMFTDIPIEELFEDVKANIEKRKSDSTQKEKYPFGEKIIPLSKSILKAYFGEFYGYTVSHDIKKNEIVPFVLHIYENEDDGPVAEYTFYNKNNEKYVFTGVPYYISELQAVAIQMTSISRKKYQYLYLHGRDYNTPKITYKSGVCVRTSTTSQNHEPDVKSFIITGERLPEDIVKKYVPGLLKMSGYDFFILKSELEKLQKENSDISDFLEYYKNQVEFIDDAVCRIKENRILINSCDNGPDEQIRAFEILTEIKKYSFAPNRIIYRNTDADFIFFENLQKNL